MKPHSGERSDRTPGEPNPITAQSISAYFKDNRGMGFVRQVGKEVAFVAASFDRTCVPIDNDDAITMIAAALKNGQRFEIPKKTPIMKKTTS